MRDVTKMKEMLEMHKRREEVFCNDEKAIDIVENNYLLSCGGFLAMPDDEVISRSQFVTVTFTADKELCIKIVNDYCNREVVIPEEFVDKFFKLIANTKSQRDVVLKGIENLRNEEAEG